MKDNIRDGDKLWNTVGNHDLIRDVINEDSSDVNSEGLTVGLTEGITLVHFDSTMLDLADFSKHGGKFFCKEGAWLG